MKLTRLVEDYRAIYGAELLSITMVTWPETTILVVLTDRGVGQLARAFDIVRKWHKKGLPTPLFLSKSYIGSSLDTFPLEFMAFQKNYHVEYGEDVLQPLTFAKSNVRLQCEREIKGKLLLLRRKYLETRGKGKDIRQLIAISLPSFIMVFYGLLYVLDREVPFAEDKIISQLTDALKLDGELFLALLRVKEGEKKPSEDELSHLLEGYLDAVNRLAQMVDKLS
ncbi:MAG: hypothetical protein QME44_09960 [Thermodesulfobacteriota bacterium]|nr:hypothetical protein [Thermodesulfobacteriota bacterium]